jgi:hypothetical protein
MTDEKPDDIPGIDSDKWDQIWAACDARLSEIKPDEKLRNEEIIIAQWRLRKKAEAEEAAWQAQRVNNAAAAKRAAEAFEKAYRISALDAIRDLEQREVVSREKEKVTQEESYFKEEATFDEATLKRLSELEQEKPQRKSSHDDLFNESAAADQLLKQLQDAWWELEAKFPGTATKSKKRPSNMRSWVSKLFKLDKEQDWEWRIEAIYQEAQHRLVRKRAQVSDALTAMRNLEKAAKWDEKNAKLKLEMEELRKKIEVMRPELTELEGLVGKIYTQKQIYIATQKAAVAAKVARTIMSKTSSNGALSVVEKLERKVVEKERQAESGVQQVNVVSSNLDANVVDERGSEEILRLAAKRKAEAENLMSKLDTKVHELKKGKGGNTDPQDHKRGAT